MNEIHFTDSNSTHEPDRVEIMGNGWVKAIDVIGPDYSEKTQYPPHRVKRVDGEVVYYE